MRKHMLLILMVLSVLCGMSAMRSSRFDTIEDFEAGSIQLFSWLNEDIQPNNWQLDATTTYNSSDYSLRLFGNTWKRQVITPVVIDSGSVISIAARTQSGARVQGIGFSDGINVLFYSLSGSLVVDIEEWINVYQGAFSHNTWNVYHLPIADDWFAFFDHLPLLTSIIYINDLDGVSSRSIWFDDILNITSDLPQAPHVTVSYSITQNQRLNSGQRQVGVQFSSFVIDPDSDVFTYRWDFGDSTFSSLPNPYHVYTITDAHPYRAFLTVTDNTGKRDFASCLIDVDTGESNLPIRMNFVGDVMLARRYELPGGIIPTQGVNAIFAPTRPFLGDAADITVANLEVVLCTVGTPHPTKSVVFRGSPNNISGLVFAGIDVVSTANNHSMDYGLAGLRQMQGLLDQAGIIHSGAGANSYEAYMPAFYNKHGLNIAFLRSSDRDGSYNNAQPYLHAGYNKPGFASMTPYHITQQINAVQGVADLKIVDMHAGSEYSLTPGANYDKSTFLYDYEDTDETSPRIDVPHMWDREIRQYAIDAGADLVIVHHPHIIQGIEVYNGKVIAHSLGNFIFDLNHPECFPSMILYADADHSGFSNFEVMPIYIRNYIPVPATGQLGIYILDYLARRSRELDSVLRVDKNRNRGQVVLNPTQTFTLATAHEIPARLIPQTNNTFRTDPIKLPRLGSISSVDDVIPSFGAMVRLGREHHWFGNFEDEGSPLWNPTFDSNVFLDGMRSARLQTTTNGQSITNTLTHRIRIYDNTRPFTLNGWIKTRNAANANIQIRFYNSRTGSQISSVNLSDGVNGTVDWTYYHRQITLPTNAFYYDLVLRVTGSGSFTQAWFDNLSVIEWMDWMDVTTLADIPHPNDFYWMQVETDHNPKSIRIHVTETEYHLDIPISTPPSLTSAIIDVKTFPNPFNPNVRLEFYLLTSQKVDIAIYNLRGQIVKKICQDHIPAGKHNFLWNGRDNNNRSVGSGVYFVRIKSGNHIQNHKIMLLK